MSLFGSLFTGVSALSAQSQSMAMISNNIANVNTVGYKRSDASFTSLVTAEGNHSYYSPGSVRANREQRISQQGALQQTGSMTDLSVSGRGFFVVQREPTGMQETYYTRAGSFRENHQGYMVNSAGFYLMGWMLDSAGNLPMGQASLSSLSPVDVAFLGGLTRPTTTGELALNLNASESQQAYPIPSTQASQFTRGLRVYDSLGAPQDVEFQFVKATSPTAQATSAVGGTGLTLSTVLDTLPDVDVGEDIVITVSSTTATFPITAGMTTQDLINAINNDAALGPLVFAEMNGNQISIKANDVSVPLTIADGVIVSGSGAATALGLPPTSLPPVFPAVGANVYPSGGLANTPNSEGWWQLRAINTATNMVIDTGYMNFNSNGSLNALPDADGEKKITLNSINWGNGSDFQTLNISIENFTQFASDYNVIYSDQNGAALGMRTGVEINREGIVVARFSNGQTVNLYKLPLATFTNPNGLSNASGNVFSETSESGSFNLRESGQGGAGLIEGATLESSNVDLADEFSKMIITQRAYSAGTKVINTADQMTEELLRLR